MPEYTLRVTNNQLQTISLALDIFSRLESGQLEWCFSMIPWKHKEKLIEAREALKKLQQLLTGLSDGNLGIGQVSDKAKIAYDLHQVIRHHIACEREPVGGETVDFNKPFQEGSEPLAKIKTCVSSESGGTYG